ncbi:MAG: ABC transporter ATP-binding protein [Alsobacter sp.]
MSLLQVHDLVVDYVGTSGRVRSLDGASLTVQSGEIVALLGESGSGKSTLAAAIGHLPVPGLLRVSGGVRIGDAEVGDLDPAALRSLRRTTLGYVVQNPVAALDPTMKLGRQVALALGADAAAAARALEGFGFADIGRVLDSYPHQVSGGMAQRVTIAMVIQRQPRLIIADEPTAALDAPVRAQVLELLVGECRRLGAALLLVTHDLQSARAFAERAAVMYAGRIVESGSAGDVLDRPRHPYTKALLRAAVGRERQGERLVPIPGLPPHLTARQTFCAFAPRCGNAVERCRTERPEVSAQHGDVLCLRIGEAAE